MINKILLEPQIHSEVHKDLGIVVTIPSFNESELGLTLNALYECQLPNCAIEVIVVFNSSLSTAEAIKQKHQLDLLKFKSLYKNEGALAFHFLNYENLLDKWAGVGLARKIAMNEASRRLRQAQNERGVIACFDADAICTNDYFVNIYNHFKRFPKTDSVSVRYAHPLMGNFEADIYNAIMQYELHLRYYVDVQKWLGLPYAFQTVGSSMVVRAYAYDIIGGMNKRKAGEDFYFLQKFIQRGNHTEINNTCIVPSPRRSDRVPFGTGRAISELLDNEGGNFNTYTLQSFMDLKHLIEMIPHFYSKPSDDIAKMLQLLPGSVLGFLESIKGHERIFDMVKNTKTIGSFKRRFFNWFDAFMLMKFVHSARDNYYENSSIEDVAKAFLRHCTAYDIDNNLSLKELLLLFRAIDDNGWMPEEFKEKINVKLV